VPVGAIMVDASNTVIAASRNCVEETLDATAHAEIDCIRRASKYLNNWRLNDCTLYSTLEPCPMCMSPLQAARVKHVVYGAIDLRLGACGSFVDLVNNSSLDNAKHPFHSAQVTGGVLANQSSLLLRRFFQVARRKDLERRWDDPEDSAAVKT
jgi:tRNA(adenine34) deaminase